jgi:hypothetical protein
MRNITFLYPLHGQQCSAKPDWVTPQIRRIPIYLSEGLQLWNVSQQRSLLQRGTLYISQPVILRLIMPGDSLTLRFTFISILDCFIISRVPSRKQTRHLPVFIATFLCSVPFVRRFGGGFVGHFIRCRPFERPAKCAKCSSLKPFSRNSLLIVSRNLR